MELFTPDQASTDSVEVGPSELPDRAKNTSNGASPVETSLGEGLPPSNTKRWVVRRKAAVVAAVQSGSITIEEVCRYYQLSEEEFLYWQRAFEIHGLAGLRATRIQQYRMRPSRVSPSRRS
jgi:transposase-like protein